MESQHRLSDPQKKKTPSTTEVYKILSAILRERLKTLHQQPDGPYQYGFRPGKFTVDQIFTLRQILEKTQEAQIDYCINFKAVYDRIYRDELHL